MNDTTLFDLPTIGLTFGDDTARARRDDPLSSHVAADTSARTRNAVRGAVTYLLGIMGPLSGNHLNDWYEAHQSVQGWPTVHFDSPRKRAGEMVKDGLLVVVNPDDPRGTPAIYALPGGTK
jgi:hypothetical protein